MSNSLAFDAIINFLSDLSEAFPESAAGLYYNLIQNIKVRERTEKAKHIKLFSDFCVANRNEIIEGKFGEFKTYKITFTSDGIEFDLHEIFNHKDFDENSTVIHKHLLTISALVDEESNAKQTLIAMESTDIFRDPEITSMFDDITKDFKVEEGADPMKTVEKLLKTESFGKLVNSLAQKVQDGDLDINNFMGMASAGNGLLNSMSKKL